MRRGRHATLIGQLSSTRDIPIGALGGRFSHIGSYRIGDAIGHGATGSVFRGYATDGTPVAIKLAHVPTEPGEPRDRFAREARIRIEHDNVVRVLDAGVHESGHRYIVLELLQGETLAEVMRRGPIPVTRVIDIGTQVCAGLVAAHARGIVHRDIKPENLFCCDGGVVKILDFGVALSQHDESRVTRTGHVLGTPAYLSPEQAHGNREIDARADIWSLGVILYQALTGVSPFDRGEVLATLLAVVMDQPLPLAVAQPSLPRRLHSAVETAMCKSRDERFRSATEFRNALASAAQESGESGVHPVPAAAIADTTAVEEKRVVALVLGHGVTEPNIMANAVTSRGGRFISLLDQRAIGLFGAHIWEGDEVIRAASAALAARHCARSLAVTSGYATLGGQQIAGDLLHTAESGCALALAGIAIDRVTADALRHRFTTQDADHAYLEVLGAKESTSSSAAHAIGRQPRTIGRQGERAQMQIALETIVEDHIAVAMLVHGAAGIGKSQLCHEMQQLVVHSDTPITTLSGRATSLSRGSDHALLLAALRNRLATGCVHLGWPRAHSRAPMEERRRALGYLINEALPTDEEKAGRCAAFLGMLLGIETDHGGYLEVARNEPRLLADRIRLSWHDYFDGLTRRGPVVLLLEDLQWADRASLELLDEALERLADRPLLIFATMRDDQPRAVRELFAGRDVERIKLRGLRPSVARKLAAAIAGGSLADELMSQIVEHTAGNPFFIEQIVSGLRENQLLDTELDTLPIPHTVDAAVQSRLDHLLPQEKELCKRAAILARPFRRDEIVALGLQDVEPLLASLNRRGILEIRRHAGDDAQDEFRFKNALVNDVAYRMNTDAMRAELHRRAARYLASLEVSDAEEIAQHCERAGQKTEASEFYARAAQAAVQRCDTVAALRCAERALQLGVSRDQHFALHMIRADAVRFLERRDYQIDALESALSAAATPAEKARALTEQAYLFRRIGRTPEALDAVTRAVAYARDAHAPDLLINALGGQAVILVKVGQYARAEQVLRAAHAVTPSPNRHQRSQFAEWRAQIAAMRGDLGERRSAFSEAVERYAEVGDVRRMVGAEMNLADVYNRLGAYVDAERALRAALGDNKKMVNPLMSGYALVNLGYSLFMQRRMDDALDALSRAAELAERFHEVPLQVCTRIYRCYAMVIDNTAAGSAELATEAAFEAERLDRPSMFCLALAVAALAHLQEGDTRRALELSTRAMNLRHELGDIEEDEALVFLAQARALAASGDHHGAERVRVQADQRIREVAASILDPALRETFLREVPAHRELLGGSRIPGSIPQQGE